MTRDFSVGDGRTINAPDELNARNAISKLPKGSGVAAQALAVGRTRNPEIGSVSSLERCDRGRLGRFSGEENA